MHTKVSEIISNISLPVVGGVIGEHGRAINELIDITGSIDTNSNVQDSPVVLNDTLVIANNGTVIKNKQYVAGPGMAGKPMILFVASGPFSVPTNNDIRLENLTLDCGAIAVSGVNIIDAWGCELNNIVVNKPVNAGIYLAGLNSQFSCQRITVSKLRVNARYGDTPNANGIILDGKVSPVNSNVSLCHFSDCFLDIDAGSCIYIHDGDTNLFEAIHCINTGNGYALWMEGRNGNMFSLFEPSAGKIFIQDLDANTILGWGYGNGGNRLYSIPGLGSLNEYP